MPDNVPLFLETGASKLLELLDFVEPELRAAVIVFDTHGWQGQQTLYSDAAATDLVRALEALLVRLRDGTLRLPVSGGVRWVDEREE